MMWFDDDVIFPLDILDIMFATGKDIVTGIYWNRGGAPKKPLLQKTPGSSMQYQFDEHEDNPLFEVSAAGFGCFFMKTEVLDYIVKPWFPLVSSDGMGEDVYFCDRIAEAGVTHPHLKLYASAKALCKHNIYEDGEYVTIPDDKIWKKANEKYNT